MGGENGAVSKSRLSMTSEELLLLVRRRPFKPFRITMATSEVFDVSHPELLIVGRSIAALGLGQISEKPIAEHIIWLDLNRIVHIQPAPGPAVHAAPQGP